MPHTTPSGPETKHEARHYNIAGIDVAIWGTNALSERRPVALMFLVHGRTGSKEDCEGYAVHIQTRLEERAAEVPSRTLLIATLDHRNHGSRTVDPVANLSFDQNPQHATDMYAIQTGTATDIAHLVNFLPAYLFPEWTDATRPPIAMWICAGISLGGHTAWLAGPAISHLVPIIASPDYAALLAARAREHGLILTAPRWPTSLGALVRACDPANMPRDIWAGKRVLAIGGGRDTLVPVREGGTVAFVDALTAFGLGDRVTLKVDEDAGHEVTPKMIDWVVEWLGKELELA